MAERPGNGKPVIFAADDDPQVLRAVERDLRRSYAPEGYRVMRADSDESALDTLGKPKLRGPDRQPYAHRPGSGKFHKARRERRFQTTGGQRRWTYQTEIRGLRRP